MKKEKKDKKQPYKGKHVREEKDVVIVTPASGSEYYDEEEPVKEEAPKAEESHKKGKGKVGSAVFKLFTNRKFVLGSICVLLVALIFTVLWVNRFSLSPANISNWFQTKLLGVGIGDGYPVELTGSNAKVGNFFSYDGNCAVLSDTVLTVRNATGDETVSMRHSYNNPSMQEASGRFVVFNQGGEGYSLWSQENGAEKFTEEFSIAAADIAGNGNYGVVTYPNDYASVLEVYNLDHELLYTYKFSDGYVTAMSLRDDGYMAAVATVYTNHGELYTKISLLDISKTEPVAEYTMNGDLVTSIHWGGNNVYAVGDTKISVSDTDYNFTDYEYGGRQLTAVASDGSRMYISISGHSYAGASTLLVFDRDPEPLTIDMADRITDISASGSVVAVLAGDMVHSFDALSGVELGDAQAGSDAHAIAMVNESSCYVLGAKEIRCVSLEK